MVAVGGGATRTSHQRRSFLPPAIRSAPGSIDTSNESAGVERLAVDMAFEPIGGDGRLLHTRAEHALGRAPRAPAQAPGTPELPDRRAAGDDNGIQPAIAEIGVRGDDDAIAILAAVRERDQELLGRDFTVADPDPIGCQGDRTRPRQRAGHVAKRAAAGARIEHPRNPRVEPDPANIQEGTAAQPADVDRPHRAGRARSRARLGASRGNPRLRARPSPEPLGTMPRLVRVPINGARDFIDGAVASPRDHAIAARAATHAAASRRAITGRGGEHDFAVDPGDASSRLAKSARAAPSTRRRPEIGLMTTASWCDCDCRFASIADCR